MVSSLNDIWRIVQKVITGWFDSRNIKATMKLASQSSDDFKVAAVIAKDWRILSTGVRGREFIGKTSVHAEKEAIDELNARQLKGSTLYTTLEPCIELNDKQDIDSCSLLIARSGIQRVVIGVLDPRGEVYTFGWRRLLDDGIQVDFFPEKYRGKIDCEFLREGASNTAYGPSSKPWTIVPDSGINFTIYKDRSSEESITFSWQTIQQSGPTVDIAARSEGNHSIALATNMNRIGDVKDWRVFRNWGHTERLSKDGVVVAQKKDASWAVLLRVLSINRYSINFHYSVRD